MLTVPKQVYTAGFTVIAVQRARDGQGVGVVASALGIAEQTLRNWGKAVGSGSPTWPGRGQRWTGTAASCIS